MAKKGNRQTVLLECNDCKGKNYVSQKNVINSKDKMTLSKFCNSCRKHTDHNETKVK